MALIGDGSMELQSISANNNISLPTSNDSVNAEQPSINLKEESIIAADDPALSKTNTASPNGTAGSINNNGKPVKMVASTTTIVILLSVATVLIVTGVTVGCFWMMIYKNFLLKELILTPTSKSYDIWKEIPIPMYLNLYLWNWTNPEEYKADSTVKPNFVQMGPYVFREQHVKVNKTWNDNGTITFQQRRIWHYQEEMSNGSLDDEVTNVNVIATTVGHFIRNEHWFIKRFVSGLLIARNESLIITRTARELLFEGYHDTLIDFARNYTTLDIPFDRFGWFYDRNGSDTYDGVFNMNTGVSDVSNLGVLDMWNYRNETDFYSSNCNQIRGTTGELWPPVTDNESVELFAPDICTSMTLSRAEDSSFVGVTGHSFVANSETFDNGTNVPSRACYCPEDGCVPSGVLGVSKCKFGAPAYVSLPHFHLADESYTDAITGMNATDDCNFSMTLEPNTGIPVNVKAQMQINILVEPIKDIKMFTDIPQTFIPVLWFKQEALLTDDFARQINLLLLIPKLRSPICITVGCIGLVLALISIYLWYQKRSRAGENQLLIAKEDGDDAAKADPVTS